MKNQVGVIPAEAGISLVAYPRQIPAFAGMTIVQTDYYTSHQGIVETSSRQYLDWLADTLHR